MNSKAFWKIRKIILTIFFNIKKVVYRIIDFMSTKAEDSSLWKKIFMSSFVGLIKAIIFVLFMSSFDGLILKIKDMSVVDIDIFIPVIIGGIGVAGVVLGLYCANITSIYSTRYANAPIKISNAFQNDRLTRKCITGIVEYIIMGFLLIGISMFRGQVSWITVAGVSIWSVVVIVSYSIAGNRTHQLSDVYGVASDSNRILYRIVSKRLIQKIFATDANFQNHFRKVAEIQIEKLKLIQKYASGINNKENTDNSSMVEFMQNNLILLHLYWLNKEKIARNSLWFRNDPKYQKWHLSSDYSEPSIALKTGTSLRTKYEHNYWWFEDEIISINKACLKRLFDQGDYISIYSYMAFYEQMCSTAIACKEADFYVKHVDWIKQELEKKICSCETEKEKRNAFAGLIEVISLLYLDLILESGKIYQKLNIEKIAQEVIGSIDSGKDPEKVECLRNKKSVEFYKKIALEIKGEGKRISPDWVIKQQIAHDEYVYLNSLIDVVREGLDHAFNLGKSLLDSKLYFEACIILTRFYEYESKLNVFTQIVEIQKNKIEEYHIDKESKWDIFRLKNLEDSVTNWKTAIPSLLFESSSKFALENWENRDEFPDFLGECYNHICEDSIQAIINGNINQFNIDFNNLSKLMLLYQEYIRSDFIKNRDLYRVEYAYYMFTSPIVEWAQIGGLAILWGEFNSDNKWSVLVRNNGDSLFAKDGNSLELAKKLIEYIQQRDRFMIGIAGRDILETGWQQEVANAIRGRNICETEYIMFSRELKTNSKLLKAFCPNFLDMGFTNDPAEVFWVECVNPMLDEKYKFHTRYSWEDKLND